MLRLLRAKPGLRVDCLDGNDRVGRANRAALQKQADENRNLELELAPVKTVKLHLLGHPGVGKTALRLCLPKTKFGQYWSSAAAIQGRVVAGGGGGDAYNDNAVGGYVGDAPEGDASNTRPTHGVSVETFTMPQFQGSSAHANLPDATFSVWDYSGAHASQALHSLNLLTSPNSIFAVVVSLTQPKEHLRRQLRHWLKLIHAACGGSGRATARDPWVVGLTCGARP